MQNNIESLITKLKDRKKYLQIWSELTPMISIDLVVDELESILNGAEGSYRRFPTTDEHLVYRNAKTSHNGNLSVTTH
jgi:uncharacterized protein YeeX (DUF496 family)